MFYLSLYGQRLTRATRYDYKGMPFLARVSLSYFYIASLKEF